LWLTENTIRDNSKNALVPIETQWSLQMGPCIIQWDLNINEGQLSIVFSEAVDPNFLIANRMAIQNVYNYSSTATITRLVLQTTSSAELSTSDATGRTVFVTLSAYDLNSFKLNSVLLASATRLFLTADYNLTRASDGGGIVPYLPTTELENRTALIVRELVEDFSPPTCLYFGLDLSRGFATFFLISV